MKSIFATTVVAAVLGWSGAASATPISFDLTNVGSFFGGEVPGGFTFDTETGAVTDVDFTTPAGFFGGGNTFTSGAQIDETLLASSMRPQPQFCLAIRP